jgi:phosphoribosylpyrophosphate synthetase
MGIKLRVDHYFHSVPNSQDEALTILKKLITKTENIMGALEDVKAALSKSNEKIDIIVPAVGEVRKDVAFIKAKLEANTGGIDAAGVAELLQVAASQDEKLGQVASDLQALDSETDSTEAEA